MAAAPATQLSYLCQPRQLPSREACHAEERRMAPWCVAATWHEPSQICELNEPRVVKQHRTLDEPTLHRRKVQIQWCAYRGIRALW